MLHCILSSLLLIQELRFLIQLPLYRVLMGEVIPGSEVHEFLSKSHDMLVFSFMLKKTTFEDQ